MLSTSLPTGLVTPALDRGAALTDKLCLAWPGRAAGGGAPVGEIRLTPVVAVPILGATEARRAAAVVAAVDSLPLLVVVEGAGEGAVRRAAVEVVLAEARLAVALVGRALEGGSMGTLSKRIYCQSDAHRPR